MRLSHILAAFIVTIQFAAGCSTIAAAASPASNLDQIIGAYVDDTGSPMVIKREHERLQLVSGPSTFTLLPAGDQRYRAVERDLLITVSTDKLTVEQGGRVVARATRGAPPAAVQFQGAALLSWLDANVPGLLQRYRVPAAAIARIEHGKVIWTRVYGERRRGVPATQDTLFNVASLTKPITAEVILRLASQHRLDLDIPMAPVFVDPDLASDQRALKLTVRMALQHRMGLPNWRTQTGNVLTFVDEPGRSFHYAGEGYTYAAHYAERVTHQPFERLAKEVLFTTLGMRNTYYTVTPAFAGSAAYPHDKEGHELWPVVRLDFSGACCLHTTIGDYARFVAAVMTDPQIRPPLIDQRFALTPDRSSEMCDPKTGGLSADTCPPKIAMGLGWFVFGFTRETVISHTGVNDGERSAAFFVPRRGFGMVILTNGANGAKLIRDVTAAAYDNPGYLRIVESQAR